MKQRYSSRIADIIHSIVGHLPKSKDTQQALFAEQFFGQMPLAELEPIDVQLASAIVADAYGFVGTRGKGENKIRTFTPSKAEQGYEGRHLIVQILGDDKPFLVDSLTNALHTLGFTIYQTFHPILRVQRDKKGALNDLLAIDSKEGHRESLIHFELSQYPEGMDATALEQHLASVLSHVELAISDWQLMLTKTVEAREATTHAKHFNQEDIQETQNFLDWLMHKNFVFLGYVGVDFVGAKIDPGVHLQNKKQVRLQQYEEAQHLRHVVIVWQSIRVRFGNASCEIH